jgi:hypothetical protein
METTKQHDCVIRILRGSDLFQILLCKSLGKIKKHSGAVRREAIISPPPVNVHPAEYKQLLSRWKIRGPKVLKNTERVWIGPAHRKPEKFAILPQAICAAICLNEPG